MLINCLCYRKASGQNRLLALKFWGSHKLHMDFQLCRRSLPLPLMLFQVQLYFINLLISSKHSTLFETTVFGSSKRSGPSSWHSESTEQTFMQMNLLKEKRFPGEHRKFSSKTYTNCPSTK